MSVWYNNGMVKKKKYIYIFNMQERIHLGGINGTTKQLLAVVK